MNDLDLDCLVQFKSLDWKGVGPLCCPYSFFFFLGKLVFFCPYSFTNMITSSIKVQEGVKVALT